MSRLNSEKVFLKKVIKLEETPVIKPKAQLTAPDKTDRVSKDSAESSSKKIKATQKSPKVKSNRKQPMQGAYKGS